jgi:hypothetical protein
MTGRSAIFGEVVGSSKRVYFLYNVEFVDLEIDIVRDSL